MHSDERERIAYYVADLLQLSHFGTLVCVSRKKTGGRSQAEGLTGFPQALPAADTGIPRGAAAWLLKKKKSAAAPLRATAPSLRYHLAPGVHVSSLPTLLNPSSFTGYDRRAGRTSLFIGFVRRPSLSYWFQRSPLDAISPLSCADGLG